MGASSKRGKQGQGICIDRSLKVVNGDKFVKARYSKTP